MRFQDEGYIIKQKKYGENSLILTLLTKEHGKILGFAKNVVSKKNLGVYQLGNKVSINAYSRLDENMLSLKTELLLPTAVNFINDAEKLLLLSSFCELCDVCMVQNEQLGKIYDLADDFFLNILSENRLTYYAFFEFYMLDFLGIGLDLEKCAVTGKSTDLKYVSPKSGKAVCAEAGAPYAAKLFKFPDFIIKSDYAAKKREVIDLLNMTEFFLRKNFFTLHDLKFPNNRASLLHNLNF